MAAKAMIYWLIRAIKNKNLIDYLDDILDTKSPEHYMSIFFLSYFPLSLQKTFKEFLTLNKKKQILHKPALHHPSTIKLIFLIQITKKIYLVIEEDPAESNL